MVRDAELVEVRGDNGRRNGQRAREMPSNDSGSGSNLQNADRSDRSHPFGEIPGVGLEDQRDEISLV